VIERLEIDLRVQLSGTAENVSRAVHTGVGPALFSAALIYGILSSL
jgi:hypothetical protein